MLFVQNIDITMNPHLNVQIDTNQPGEKGIVHFDLLVTQFIFTSLGTSTTPSAAVCKLLSIILCICSLE